MWGPGKRAEPARSLDCEEARCWCAPGAGTGAWARCNRCLRSERSRRELRFFLEDKGPRGENHEVVEVPSTRLARKTACRNSAVAAEAAPSPASDSASANRDPDGLAGVIARLVLPGCAREGRGRCVSATVGCLRQRRSWSLGTRTRDGGAGRGGRRGAPRAVGGPGSPGRHPNPHERRPPRRGQLPARARSTRGWGATSLARAAGQRRRGGAGSCRWSPTVGRARQDSAGAAGQAAVGGTPRGARGGARYLLSMSQARSSLEPTPLSTQRPESAAQDFRRWGDPSGSARPSPTAHALPPEMIRRPAPPGGLGMDLIRRPRRRHPFERLLPSLHQPFRSSFAVQLDSRTPYSSETLK